MYVFPFFSHHFDHFGLFGHLDVNNIVHKIRRFIWIVHTII
jgi:hypothetical protein